MSPRHFQKKDCSLFLVLGKALDWLWLAGLGPEQPGPLGWEGGTLGSYWPALGHVSITGAGEGWWNLRIQTTWAERGSLYVTTKMEPHVAKTCRCWSWTSPRLLLLLTLGYTVVCAPVDFFFMWISFSITIYCVCISAYDNNLGMCIDTYIPKSRNLVYSFNKCIIVPGPPQYIWINCVNLSKIFKTQRILELI